MVCFQKNKHKVVKKKWVDNDMEKALSDVAGGISIRKAAKTHHMVEGTLQRRIKMKERGEALVGSGHKQTLSPEIEVSGAFTIIDNYEIKSI